MDMTQINETSTGQTTLDLNAQCWRKVSGNRVVIHDQ